MAVTTAPSCQVVLTGRVDVNSVTEIRSMLHHAIDSGDGDLVIDVSGVELIDATGLGVLVGAHRRAVMRGRRVVLQDVPPRVSRILRATRLDRVFCLDPAPAA